MSNNDKWPRKHFTRSVALIQHLDIFNIPTTNGHLWEEFVHDLQCCQQFHLNSSCQKKTSQNTNSSLHKSITNDHYRRLN